MTDHTAAEMLEEMAAETPNDVAEGNVWPDNFDGSDLEETETADGGPWERIEKLGFDMEPGDGIFSPVDPPGLEGVVHYVMDLEALVRWLALTFSHYEYDEEGNETTVVNDPIWTVYDERGTHLPAAEKLQATWDKVMHPDA